MTWAEPSEQGHSAYYGQLEPTLTTNCRGLLGKVQAAEVAGAVPLTEIKSSQSDVIVVTPNMGSPSQRSWTRTAPAGPGLAWHPQRKLESAAPPLRGAPVFQYFLFASFDPGAGGGRQAAVASETQSHAQRMFTSSALGPAPSRSLTSTHRRLRRLHFAVTVTQH